MFPIQFLLAALLSAAPAAEPPTEFARAFEARNLDAVMRLWSDEAPGRLAGRKRLTRLAHDGVHVTVSANRIEVRDAAQTLLEQYELVWKDGRVSSLTPVESSDALARAREQLHRGAEQLEGGAVEEAHAAFTLAAQLADTSGHAATRAAAQRGLGDVSSTRGDSASAIAHFEKSLAIAKEAGDAVSTGRALERLAYADRLTGKYPRAESRYREALQIFRDGGQRLLAANAVFGLGVVHAIRSQHAEARPYFAEALATFEELGDAENTGHALNALGINHRMQGSYREAVALLERALEKQRAVESLLGIANAQGNLGIAQAKQGNLAEALQAFREALAIHERLGRAHPIMISLGNTGEMYRLLGDTEQAREHYQKGLAIAEKAGFKPGVAMALHNLAQIRLDEDDPRGAIALYEKSLAIDTATGDRDGIARTLHNIGRAHIHAGDRAAARRSLAKSFAISEELGNREEMSNTVGNRSHLAETPAEALELAQQAMTIAADMQLPEQLRGAHLALGRAYRRAGQIGEARVEIERAVAIAEELRRVFPGEEVTQQQAFSTMVAPYHDMVGLLVDERDIAGALEYAERAKARVLLDVLRHGRPDLRSALTEGELKEESALAAQLASISREHREALVGGKVAPELLGRVRKARFAYENFLEGAYVAHPQLRLESGDVDPVRATDIAALLANGAADVFVEFVVTEDATYVFTVNAKNGVRAHTIEITRRQLTDDVRRFRELLATHDLTYATSARALYDRLLGPLAAQLRGKKTICIVPDGPLWELPFQALQPSAGEFLLDRHAVYYTPSLTVLREVHAHAPAASRRDVRLLAFGNPVMPRETPGRNTRVRRDASLAPLPQTETEIRGIASLYGGRNSRLYVRADAREEVAKAEAGSFDVLHFAMHGVLDDQNALYSRLVFSPSASQTEDGLLEAREIMRLDLHADLAVLSACETARGRVGAGEGLIGMSWALFVSGVPTSVVSQWNVDSASTSDLMIEFHRHLRVDARSTAEAMRRAALATRAKAAYRHPFYWAPFVVVGNGR